MLANLSIKGRFTSYLGWCVVGAAVSQLPVLMSGLVLMQSFPKAGRALLIFSLPTVLILLVSGIGLILRKAFGYYGMYVATFFGGFGFGGLKIAYLPFIRNVRLGPATEDLVLGINILIVAILVWLHFKEIQELESSRQDIHRILTIVLLVLGAGSILVGRSMVHRDKGQVASAAELPYIGSQFQKLTNFVPIRFISVYTKPNHGLILVFAANSSEASIKQLAEQHRLKQMTEPEAHKKFLPQVKAWKLNPNEFPSQFAPNDLYYVGRLSQAPKASCQLVYRKTDGYFTAQIFGILP